MKKAEFQLDPDKRDWEYDGYGVKRYKENFQQVVEENKTEPVKELD